MRQLLKTGELKIFLCSIYFWEQERQTTSGWGAEIERRENSKQAQLRSAHSPTQGLIPWTVRSWPEPKSPVQMPNRLTTQVPPDSLYHLKNKLWNHDFHLLFVIEKDKDPLGSLGDLIIQIRYWKHIREGGASHINWYNYDSLNSMTHKNRRVHNKDLFFLYKLYSYSETL